MTAPLDGFVVADPSAGIVGGYCTKHLAEVSPNTTKRDLTLDMSSQRGGELASELIEQSDVVVENHSPRVMEIWGLGWEEVRRINPRAIMVRAPAFGITGPWRDRSGYAQTMEMAVGPAWMTGYADAALEIPNGPMDPIAPHEPVSVEQLKARGFWETVEHPITGMNTFLGYPARLCNGPSQLNRAHAPLLGQHNREVLVELIGRSDPEVGKLQEEGVIGTVPGGSGHAW